MCKCVCGCNIFLVLTGAFKLAEVDLIPLLPPEALASFAEEISGRQKRRDSRAEQGARMAQREAAAAADAAAAAAIKGLTAQELKVRGANLNDRISQSINIFHHNNKTNSNNTGGMIITTKIN